MSRSILKMTDEKPPRDREPDSSSPAPKKEVPESTASYLDGSITYRRADAAGIRYELFNNASESLSDLKTQLNILSEFVYFRRRETPPMELGVCERSLLHNIRAAFQEKLPRLKKHVEEIESTMRQLLHDIDPDASFEGKDWDKIPSPRADRPPDPKQDDSDR